MILGPSGYETDWWFARGVGLDGSCRGMATEIGTAEPSPDAALHPLGKHTSQANENGTGRDKNGNARDDVMSAVMSSLQKYKRGC